MACSSCEDAGCDGCYGVDYIEYIDVEYVEPEPVPLPVVAAEIEDTIGRVVVSEGVEFEVIWAGGEGLIPDRATKPSQFWTAPKRIYNKKSDFWTTPRTKPVVDKPVQKPEDTSGDEV